MREGAVGLAGNNNKNVLCSSSAQKLAQILFLRSKTDMLLFSNYYYWI